MTPQLLTQTASGFVQCLPLAAFERQHRGGCGSMGAGQLGSAGVLRREFNRQGASVRRIETEPAHEPVERITWLKSHQWLFFASSDGRLTSSRSATVPLAGKEPRATFLDILPFEAPSKLGAVLPVFEHVLVNDSTRTLLSVTRQGRVARCPISSMAHLWTGDSTLKNADMASLLMQCRDGDAVAALLVCEGTEDLLLTSSDGRVLRTSVAHLPITAARTKGVGAMALRGTAHVLSAQLTRGNVADQSLCSLVVTTAGLGRLARLSTFPVQEYGGQGVVGFKPSRRTGALAAHALCYATDDAVIVTRTGMLLRCSLAEVPLTDRATSGVTLIGLSDGDHVIGAVTIPVEG